MNVGKGIYIGEHYVAITRESLSQLREKGGGAMATIDNDLGKRLRGLREMTGASQADFAALLGISATRYGAWERGTSTPTVKSLRKVRRVLSSVLGRRVEWSELLGA